MKRLIIMTFLALAAFTGSATAQTTLVIAIAADPTGFDPEAVLNNTLLCELYHDLDSDEWFVERVYD